MARSNEAFWWGLFSAGGVVSAFLLPVTLLITAIAVPAGWVSAEELRQLIGHPLARLYLMVVISLTMFHAAHRVRHTAAEFSEMAHGTAAAVVCYGAAFLVTALAAFFLISS